MTRIIPREEWGARYGDGAGSRPLPATEAWLHHSVTIAPDLNPPYDDDYRSIQTIDDIGKDRFGWTYGFPYTFGITPVGLIFEGHDVRKMGAHTGGHNYQAIGIVFVGNYESSHPTEAQLDACAWLLRECVRKGWLTKAALTGGHRDLKATACPGRYAYAQIAEINRRATLPEEDDMPTAKEIVDELLDRKLGQYFHTDPKRERSMTVRSALGGGARYSFWTLATLDALKPLIKAAAEGKALSAEQVQQIADAAAAAVPEGLAADVVDELSGRLNANEGTPS